MGDMWTAASDRDYYGDEEFPETEEPESAPEKDLKPLTLRDWALAMLRREDSSVDWESVVTPCDESRDWLRRICLLTVFGGGVGGSPSPAGEGHDTYVQVERLVSERDQLKLDVDMWREAHDFMNMKAAKAMVECKQLRASLDQVDGVLAINWVGPRKDGDYRKALVDLVAQNISDHEFFSKEAEKEREKDR